MGLVLLGDGTIYMFARYDYKTKTETDDGVPIHTKKPNPQSVGSLSASGGGGRHLNYS